MVHVTKLDNPDMMKLLDVPMISTFINTRQELLIKLRIDMKRYKAWMDRQDEDEELEDDFREDIYAAMANDVLLYVFGLTGGMPERDGSRESNMADYFWKEQGIARPTTKEALLATEQLAKYLIYDSKDGYTVPYEVYGDDTELLPEDVAIRFQLAEPLDDTWEGRLEERMNELFSPGDQKIRYRHWTTRLYDLAGITLGNHTN